MVIDISTVFEGAGGAITACGGLWAGYRHIRYGIADKKERYRAAIIAEAKEEMAKVEAKMSVRINNLEAELSNQKDNMVRDLGHMKEVYNAEIKVLGEKIDSLRSDLQDQHQSMVNLLTRLVNSK
jgi:hypothetical protein